MQSVNRGRKSITWLEIWYNQSVNLRKKYHIWSLFNPVTTTETQIKPMLPYLSSYASLVQLLVSSLEVLLFKMGSYIFCF